MIKWDFHNVQATQLQSAVSDYVEMCGEATFIKLSIYANCFLKFTSWNPRLHRLYLSLKLEYYR